MVVALAPTWADQIVFPTGYGYGGRLLPDRYRPCIPALPPPAISEEVQVAQRG